MGKLFVKFFIGETEKVEKTVKQKNADRYIEFINH
jgi:hypothetical protein